MQYRKPDPKAFILDEDGKLIGLEVLDATEKYSLADIFNVATENLIFEREMAP